jgi:hypothetical protein
MCVHESNGGNRSATDKGCEAGQVVIDLFGAGIQNTILMQIGKTLVFVFREWGNYDGNLRYLPSPFGMDTEALDL